MALVNEIAVVTLEGLSEIDETVERKVSEQELDRMRAGFSCRMKKHGDLRNNVDELLKATLDMYFRKHIMDTIQTLDVDRQIGRLIAGGFPVQRSFIAQQRFRSELMVDLTMRLGGEKFVRDLNKEIDEWQCYIAQMDDICVAKCSELELTTPSELRHVQGIDENKTAISNMLPVFNDDRAMISEKITAVQAREDYRSENIDKSYWINERAVRLYEKYGEKFSKVLDEHTKIKGESFDA